MERHGVWMLDTSTLTLSWIGEWPIPKPAVRERMMFAWIYMISSRNGFRFVDFIKRSVKAFAFCLKPAHVAWSGKPNVTTGRSIEEEWTNFNLISCVLPQSGQGSPDNLDAS